MKNQHKNANNWRQHCSKELIMKANFLKPKKKNIFAMELDKLSTVLKEKIKECETLKN